MSEMPPEPQPGGGGGMFRPRNLLIVAGVAVVAYFLFFRKTSATGGGTSTGGGGAATTGDITATQGTTTVNVQAPTQTVGLPGKTGVPNPQPKPPVPGKRKVHSTSHRTYTVKPGETLASIAKKFNISVATLAHANVYVPGEVPGNKKVGQRLGTGAGLKTGQVLVIP